MSAAGLPRRAGSIAGFAVAVALGLVGLAAGLFPIFDGDVFWHLAAGRWIVENGTVPRVDPFRFAPAPLPWVDHEWLFQVVLYGLERTVGLDGLIVVRALALAGFGLLLFRLARRSGLDAGLSGFVALGAVLGVRPRFLDRPEIVTLFAIVLLLSLLESREGGEEGRLASKVGSAGASPRDRGVLAILLLVVVWVNFHGEALLAPALGGLFLVGAALDDRGEDSPDVRGRLAVRAREIVGLPLACGVALVANPYGWRLVEVPLGIRSALADLGALNPEWLPAWRAPQPYLFAGLAVVATLAVAARLERGRWIDLRWGLPAAALAVVALGAVRHQALFYAAAAPYAARCLAALEPVRAAGDLARRRLAVLAVLGILAAGLWAAFPPVSGPFRPRHGSLRLGTGLSPGRFPERMAANLATAPPDAVGPLYNELLHGGYLLWTLFPPRTVFLDGRMELEPGLLHELVAARRSAAEWTDLMRRRGVEGALVRYESRRVPVVEPGPDGALRVVDARTPNDLLFPPEAWDLVDWDDDAMLFLARGRHAWPRPAYRFVRPEDPERMARLAAADPSVAEGIERELERKLAEQPGSRRARTLLRAVQATSSAPAGRRLGPEAGTQ